MLDGVADDGTPRLRDPERANPFYRIDREKRVRRFLATRILPFGDATSFGSYLEVETSLYSSIEG